MATVTENINAMAAALEGLRKDAAGCEAGNQAAGTRIRGVMQDIKAMAQEVREDVLSLREKNASKKK